MKIGINTTPLNSAHKLRGIGYYTNNLLNYLKKEDLQIVEFTDSSKIAGVDLLHYPWFDFYFHTLPVKRKFKRVVTIHDTIPLKFPSHYPVGIRGKINFILQKLALRNVDAIITDSQISKKDIIKNLKLKEEKIFPIHLAPDPDFRVLNDTKLLQTKRKFNLPNKFLLYVGDANWTKNLPFLIEGFAKLLKNEQLKDLALVLVGGVFLKKLDNIDHPELKSLKLTNELIKNLNLNDKVYRPGNLEKEELIAFYNLATIYVQPSLYEGFGLPVLEAFSCGTPVVCSKGGSLPEVAGDAAVYFDPDNLDQFISIATEVLTNRSLQKKLSDSAVKQSLKFSWEKVVKQTKEVYEWVYRK